MTTESPLLFLELPSSVSMASAVQPLTDAAKEFLANKYRDLSKSQDELTNLPLAGIEAILSSDILQVASEDAVYDFLLKWARAQYPKLEERREILGSRLGRLVRFPYMTCRKLRKVLTCNDLDNEISTKAVLEALFFKAETPHRQRALASEESAVSRRFVERAYKYRPVKVVEFELPHPQCIVYLDLKREECANLFPSGRVYPGVSLGWAGILSLSPLQYGSAESVSLLWPLFGDAREGLCHLHSRLRVCCQDEASR
ncbi:BTB/POZ domain-containing protein POB1-like [Iris pallida]|uniref:BTB/POZ domain-containing protein POB1-like n=1 Tax=Iris pallida TaxID=29817 RepID=A0AAX6EY19_IRIPA|nr:BTB/POZ domain-containing protein POB1-like [Iris pallida]